MRSVEVYTLDELRSKFPEGYDAVKQRWERKCQNDGFIPWQDEIIESLKAIVLKCDFRLKNYEIGPDSYSAISIETMDDQNEDNNDRGRDWFRDNVLVPLEYVNADGNVYFPGNCAFTGVCFDDDLLEKVWGRLCEGKSLYESLKGMAMDASRMMEAECEYRESEEEMLIAWDEQEFLADGTPI